MSLAAMPPPARDPPSLTHPFAHSSSSLSPRQASESTPLLGESSAGGAAGLSSSSNGVGPSSGARKWSGGSGASGAADKGATGSLAATKDAGKAAGGSSSTAAPLVDPAGQGAATATGARTAAPQPPPYSVEDLAAITAWARHNFLDVAAGGRGRGGGCGGGGTAAAKVKGAEAGEEKAEPQHVSGCDGRIEKTIG